MKNKKVWWAIMLERSASDVLESYHLNVAMNAGSREGYTRLAIPYGRTDAVRNLAARKFLALSKDPDDTLVMLDQDHAHPPDVIARLVATDAPVVGALAFQRGAPYGPCFYLRHPVTGKLGQAVRWDKGALYPCDGIGHAAIAIQRRTFEAIWRSGALYPWWRYTYPNLADLVEVDGRLLIEPDRDPIILPSEDLYFSRLCEQAGIKLICDTALICPHKIEGGWIDETSWENWLEDHPVDSESVDIERSEQPRDQPVVISSPAPAASAALASGPRQALVDIIIPGHGNFDLTERLLASMQHNTGPLYRVLYVDDGSPKPDLERFKVRNPALAVIHNPIRLGFVRSVNAGLMTAYEGPAEFILLLNNDVAIPGGDASWLTRWLEPFQDAKVAAVGAVSDNVYGAQRRPQPTKPASETTTTEAKWLIGFALLLRRSALNEVGYLDERFGEGNYEDMDLSLRLRMQGYRLLIAESVWLFHKMHATFEKLGAEKFNGLLETNRAAMRAKWGDAKLAEFGLSLAGEPAPAIHRMGAKEAPAAGALPGLDDYATMMPVIESWETAQANFLGALLFERLRPEKVIDLGCGPGNYLLPFAERGSQVMGIDGELSAGRLLAGRGDFIRHDLRLPFLVGNGGADLCLCVEVAEHLQPEYAETLVENCTTNARMVFWSAAHQGQGGTFHHNEQPVKYWERLFQAHGFVTHPKQDAILEAIRNNPECQKVQWLIPNARLFVRRSLPNGN